MFEWLRVKSSQSCTVRALNISFNTSSTALVDMSTVMGLVACGLRNWCSFVRPFYLKSEYSTCNVADGLLHLLLVLTPSSSHYPTTARRTDGRCLSLGFTLVQDAQVSRFDRVFPSILDCGRKGIQQSDSDWTVRLVAYQYTQRWVATTRVTR